MKPSAEFASVRPGKRAALACTLELPPDFRPGDLLAFHRRDPSALAERVEGDTLQKGLTWQGHAARLTVGLRTGYADAILDVDGPPSAGAPDALDSLVRRMLGLTQQVEEFERAYRAHPQLGPLIARHPGLRVPLLATPFEALIWAIAGQQISVHAALSLRKRLIELAGSEHSSGLRCHPDAEGIARLSESALRQAGFSRTKAETLIALSRRVHDKELPLDDWLATIPVDEIRARLLSVRGMGPWTVAYALLRGFGWLDGSLHGDVAVRRGLRALIDASEKVTEHYAKRWLADFSPWRALVAAHLWTLRPYDSSRA